MKWMLPGIGLTIAFATASLSAPPTPLITGSAKDELAGNLRGLFLQNLPTPLYEKENNWGHQTTVKRRHIEGKLGDLHIEVMHQPKNDGVWKKLHVDAVNPAESVVFDLRDIANVEPGKITFQVFAALDTQVNYTHQRLESGLKLFDASARAKVRVKVTLDCVATSRVEGGVLLPDLVIEIKVAKADVKYDNLKFEHIAGIGGEGAQLIGEAGPCRPVAVAAFHRKRRTSQGQRRHHQGRAT